MKLRQQLSRDKEKLKGIPDWKGKITFILDYYLIAILVIAFLVVSLGYTVIHRLTQKQVVLYTVLVNTDQLIAETDDSVFNQMLEDSGYDMNKKTVDVNKSLLYGMEMHEEEDVQTLQVLNALFTISDLDLFAANQELFDLFAKEDAFANLSLLIDKEILEMHKEQLYIYQDSSGNEIVGGIILSSGSKLHKAGFYHNEVIIGIANHAVYFDEALIIIQQLLND